MKKLQVIILLTLCSCYKKSADEVNIEKAVKELKNMEACMRSNAVYNLGKFGAYEYVKDIAAALKDEDAGVRCEAVFALFELGARKYANDIDKLLKDENANVRETAKRVLKEWNRLPADSGQHTEKGKDTEQK